MKKKTLVNLIAILVALVVVVVCSIFIQATEIPDGGSRYYSTFVALLPPLIAIALALITKEVYSSLFIGMRQI